MNWAIVKENKVVVNERNGYPEVWGNKARALEQQRIEYRGGEYSVKPVDIVIKDV